MSGRSQHDITPVRVLQVVQIKLTIIINTHNQFPQVDYTLLLYKTLYYLYGAVDCIKN